MTTSHPANDDARREREPTFLDVLEPFDCVLDRVEERHRRALPDEVVHVSELVACDHDAIRLQNGAEFALTSWSRKQLAAMLGVRWDRFFENTTPSERAAQITARLERIPEQKKLRTFRARAPGERGELRAIVSPSFVPIDDVRIFRAMKKMMGSALDRFGFRRVELTDSASFYHAVSRESVRVGDDQLHPGFFLRSSEVGASAVTIDDAWFRVVCSNGLMLPVGGKRGLYRTHRAMADEALEAAIVLTLSRLPERWTKGVALLEAARAHTIKHPADAIEAMLDAPAIPREIVRKALGVALVAHASTAYDVVQAVTLTAHTENKDPHLRFELEKLAGEYLTSNVRIESVNSSLSVRGLEAAN